MKKIFFWLSFNPFVGLIMALGLALGAGVFLQSQVLTKTEKDLGAITAEVSKLKATKGAPVIPTASLEGLSLGGVMQDAGSWICLINDKVYTVGQSIGDHTIEHIDAKGVDLRNKTTNELNPLRLKQAI